MKSRMMRWEEHVTRMGQKMNEYRILVEKLEGKSPLGKRRRWWMDDIKMDLRDRWGGIG
jgi:hypothetical protein